MMTLACDRCAEQLEGPPWKGWYFAGLTMKAVENTSQVPTDSRDEVLCPKCSEELLRLMKEVEDAG